MRVLFISQDFPPDIGGIQTYSWEIGRRLAPLVGEAAIVAPRRPGSDLVDAELGTQVYRLPARPDLLPLAAVPALPVLARRHRADVSLHAQWQTAAAALVARSLTGYPRRIAVAAHGRELLFNQLGEGAPGRLFDRLRFVVLKNVDLFLPVSHYTASLLERWRTGSQRVEIVHNGTDSDRFRPVDGSSFRAEIGAGDRPLLLFVGRLVERKGIDTILRALPDVRARVPDVLLVIAGDGPDRTRLERLANDLDVRMNVRFQGGIPYDTLPRVYSAADVFVMPSKNAEPDVEGFGIVFLEANACGCPVVGARSGGIPDAILHGETGYIVEPDDTAALAERLSHLLAEPSLRKRMGARGRQRIVEDLTWEHVSARVVDALRALE